MERWRQQQALAAQQGYSQQGAPQQGYQQPGHGYGQPEAFDPGHFGHPPQQAGYGQPQAPASGAPVRNPFEPPFGEPAHQYAAPQQASHFDRFASVPSPQEHPAAYDPHHLAGGGPEPMQDPFGGHRAPQSYDGGQGFDPHQGFGSPAAHPEGQHGGHMEPRADPQSWDFSNYHPSQVPQGYQEQAGLHDAAQPEWGSPAPAAHDQQWSQQQAGQGHWGGPEGEYPQGQHHYDPNVAGQHQHYQLDPDYDHGHQHLGADMGTDDYEMQEEPRRRPSVVLVIGMLIGAIVVGGGLAVAYRHFGGGGHASQVAEIKRQAAPEKVRPDDPGGKTVEHAGNVFLNRADGSSSGDTRQSDVDGSAKKVATIPIVVNRDGSLTPQSSSGLVGTSSDGSGVPGLVLDGLGPPPGPPALRPGMGPAPAPERHAAASRMPPPPPSVERAPRIADLPLPKVTNAAPPPHVTAAVDDPVPPPMRKPAVVPQREARAVISRDAASGVGAGGLDAPSRSSAHAISRSGYVAVLASKRSRQEALNTFADLHSQYPEILGGVTPDVREANLGDKGVWYRLIGGPPGSREAARGICVKLKARGMKDCWPVAY